MDYKYSRISSSKRGVMVWLVCLGVVVISSSAAAEAFKCNNSSGTCDAVVDYLLPNTTTLSHLKTLFNVKNLRSILGANNLSLSTPPNQTLPANHTLKIPFPCLCSNGTGRSNHRPLYTVVPDDGLYHIAAEVFSGLVTFQEIQAANNISDANLIEVGQKLWIPLPCSCDDVDGQKVVHYGHLVAPGSSVEGIAQQFNTTSDALLKLNGLASPKDLKAGAILDVPLRACASMVSNRSLDYPLLVPNGTYAFTATNCVKCNCDAANNWMLQCEPTQIKSSVWASCPNKQCQGTDNLYLGKITSSNCNRTTCAYAGYNNQTILTTTASESTCPDNNSSAMIMRGSWKRNLSFFVLVHLLLLYLWI